MKVLVLHPGIQHAHQLAWALEENGSLALFCSGVPVRESGRAPRPWESALHEVPIPVKRRKHYVLFPILRRSLSRFFPSSRAARFNYLLYSVFDRLAARLVRRVRPDLVVCYENAALHTFRAAKELGCTCVLDAASVHHSVGAHWGVVNDSRSVRLRKQLEIQLADGILTCSQLAAATYIESGVAKDRVIAVPLGTRLPSSFHKHAARQNKLTVVFAGTPTRTKGVDLLLDAFSLLETEGAPIRLTIVGGVGDPELEARARMLSNVTRKKFMPQSELFSEYARHDCLVLPSRLDSFGMVVAESMAVGTPAVVSERVGAKCIIEESSSAGWIVACDADAIKQRLSWLQQNPQAISSASEAARKAATQYSWERYRVQVAGALRQIHTRASQATHL